MTYQTPELVHVGSAQGLVLGDSVQPLMFHDHLRPETSRNSPLL
jgi:hypothetical protein